MIPQIKVADCQFAGCTCLERSTSRFGEPNKGPYVCGATKDKDPIKYLFKCPKGRVQAV